MSTGSGTGGKPVLVVLAAGMAKRFGGGCKPLAPLGLHGEAVIDLNAGDALRGGFGPVVLVLGPQTGPAIEYHVRRIWPERVEVGFALQPVALGTAHAVLCARSLVGDRPFAVINADDVYGTPAFETLAGHLAGGTGHALVGYPLADTVVTDDPVTRGTCEVDAGGSLVRMAERKLVSRQPDGTFRSADGREPADLDPATPVSMNLWGLLPSVWPVLEEAVLGTHPEVAPDGTLGSPPASTTEVLLPEVIGNLADSGRAEVRVLPGSGRCVGVTHYDDLPATRAELALMVAEGQRRETPWEGLP